MKRLTFLFLLAVVSLCHASPVMAHLHPNLQRFVQRDPLRYTDGPNFYERTRNNPTLLDYDGCQSYIPRFLPPGLIDTRSFDISKDIAKYNCAGLAFRTYTYMNTADTVNYLKAHGNSINCSFKAGACQPPNLKCWLYTFTWEIREAVQPFEIEGQLVASGVDFHIECTEAGTWTDPVCLTKNGPDPVKGPLKPGEWVPVPNDAAKALIKPTQTISIKALKKECFCVDNMPGPSKQNNANHEAQE